MKKKDVPQHNAFLKEGKVRDIVYCVNNMPNAAINQTQYRKIEI